MASQSMPCGSLPVASTATSQLDRCRSYPLPRVYNGTP